MHIQLIINWICIQVRTFGVQTGLVMPVFRQGKRELFLSNTDNTDITDIIVSHQ